jgi:hypothetical protein
MCKEGGHVLLSRVTLGRGSKTILPVSPCFRVFWVIKPLDWVTCLWSISLLSVTISSPHDDRSLWGRGRGTCYLQKMVSAFPYMTNAGITGMTLLTDKKCLAVLIFISSYRMFQPCLVLLVFEQGTSSQTVLSAAAWDAAQCCSNVGRFN